MSWLRLFIACALLAPMVAFADSATPKPSPADAKTTSDTDKENAGIASIPPGQVYHGVHIPNYSPTGKLLMLFDAQSAKRIADRDIEMQELKIEIHNNDGSTFHVEMKHSVFNLDTRILTSDTPTTIKRDDFVINGSSAEFHTKEKFGRVFGNVKMIINSGDTK
jgi:hypothetical protein